MQELILGRFCSDAGTGTNFRIFVVAGARVLGSIAGPVFEIIWYFHSRGFLYPPPLPHSPPKSV